MVMKIILYFIIVLVNLKQKTLWSLNSQETFSLGLNLKLKKKKKNY